MAIIEAKKSRVEPEPVKKITIFDVRAVFSEIGGIPLGKVDGIIRYYRDT